MSSVMSIKVGSKEYVELLSSTSKWINPQIKGIHQFYKCGLHLKFEKKDNENSIAFFESSYDKGWTDCIIAHRNSTIGCFEYPNYDAWLKTKDQNKYKQLFQPAV